MHLLCANVLESNNLRFVPKRAPFETFRAIQIRCGTKLEPMSIDGDASSRCFRTAKDKWYDFASIAYLRIDFDVPIKKWGMISNVLIMIKVINLKEECFISASVSGMINFKKSALWKNSQELRKTYIKLLIPLLLNISRLKTE